MERLTIEYCGEYLPKELCSIDKLGGADDCDLCFEYCKATEECADCTNCAINKCFNRLGEYENLEEQGKLLKLPCVVGDTIYILNTLPSGKVVLTETKADTFIIALSVMEKRFGKTVFLTKSEAEQAVKERRKINK